LGDTQARFEIMFAFHVTGLPESLLSLWSMKDLNEYMDYFNDRSSNKKRKKKYTEGNLGKIL